MNNFEFEHNGETYWYSRSMTVVTYIFVKRTDRVYVLADKRGSALPRYKGRWNCPGGYLDFNERAKEAACREVYEETGVAIHPIQLHLFSIFTEPVGKIQNMNISFWVYIEDGDNFMETNELTTKYADTDEVEDVCWIDIEKLSNYKWAYGQQKTIMQLYRTYIKPSSIWKFLMYKLWLKLNRKYGFLRFR